MGTQSTAAEGHFELEEKYRRWQETYLPAGDATATYPLDQQLQALGDERLKAAHEAAMAGLAADRQLPLRSRTDRRPAVQTGYL